MRTTMQVLHVQRGRALEPQPVLMQRAAHLLPRALFAVGQANLRRFFTCCSCLVVLKVCAPDQNTA